MMKVEQALEKHEEKMHKLSHPVSSGGSPTMKNKARKSQLKGLLAAAYRHQMQSQKQAKNKIVASGNRSPKEKAGMQFSLEDQGANFNM